jgi:hypothetical protein
MEQRIINNLPINPERRDPSYSKKKGDVGLSNTPNMSFGDIQDTILSNVINKVNEGTIYNFIRSDEESLKSNIVKLKPNTSMTTIYFSLGTYDGSSEFIGYDSGRLDLIVSGDGGSIINYKLQVNNNTENNSVLKSSKFIFRKFLTGGYLISLEIQDKSVDSIWINMIGGRNIDPQNPMEDIWTGSGYLDESVDPIEILCDISRDSFGTSIESDMEGVISSARELTHDINVIFDCVDPDDDYNSNTEVDRGHSFSTVDPTTEGVDYNSDIKSLGIKTTEEDNENPQNIPLTINRLNHPIKFKLYGSLNKQQELSWESGLSSSSNKSGISAHIDTARGVDNNIPIGISSLTHDIDIKIGQAEYLGSIPETNKDNDNKQGFGSEDESSVDYTEAIFTDGKVNYASFSSSSSAKDIHYEYEVNPSTNVGSWVKKTNPYEWKPKEKVYSLNTGLSNDDKEIPNNDLNLIIHGLDHDILLEVVDSNYRKDRGIATLELSNKEGFEFESDVKYSDGVTKVSSGISNLSWVIGDEEEKKKYSCSTGSIKLNTFEKRAYQALDLKIHGLDHEVKARFYRGEVSSAVRDPECSKEDNSSNEYRKESNGQDLLGDISIDTFTNRTQRINLSVIDGRYTDSSRGLAITDQDSNGKYFIPHTDITDNGSYGVNKTSMNFEELSKYYPTINGVPFTGDFRHSVPYIDKAGEHKVGKTGTNILLGEVPNSNLRNIDIFAYHAGDSLDKAGNHKWETLSSLRIAKTKEDTQSSTSDSSAYVSTSEIRTRSEVSGNDSDNSEYGVVRLCKSREKVLTKGSTVEDLPNSLSNISGYLDSLKSDSDDDVVTVKVLRRLMAAIVGGSQLNTSGESTKVPLSNEKGLINQINSDLGSLTLMSVPVGTIVPWYNKEFYRTYTGTESLPSSLTDKGWAICDGTNGTPDLRGAYLRGFDNQTYSSISTSVKLGAGGTGIKHRKYTSEESDDKYLRDNVFGIPSHSHLGINNYTDSNSDSGASGGMKIAKAYKWTSPPNPPTELNWGKTTIFNGLTDGLGGVTNKDEVNRVSEGGTPFQIEPYYFKMIYIMKIN